MHSTVVQKKINYEAHTKARSPNFIRFTNCIIAAKFQLPNPTGSRYSVRTKFGYCGQLYVKIVNLEKTFALTP